MMKMPSILDDCAFGAVLGRRVGGVWIVYIVANGLIYMGIGQTFEQATESARLLRQEGGEK